MIFLPVVTKLDRLSIYLPLFQFEKYLQGRLAMCLSGRMVKALCVSPAAEDRRVSSITVQPYSLWVLMSNAQIQLYVQ